MYLNGIRISNTTTAPSSLISYLQLSSHWPVAHAKSPSLICVDIEALSNAFMAERKHLSSYTQSNILNLAMVSDLPSRL